MNRVILNGNLVADPEGRFSQAGKQITNFRIAVSGRNDKTDFFDVTTFDKLAENIVKFKVKGDPVLLEGRLAVDVWDDKSTGAKRSKVYIIADNVEFLSSGKGQSGEEKSAPTGNKPPARSPAKKPAPAPVEDFGDEADIPF